MFRSATNVERFFGLIAPIEVPIMLKELREKMTKYWDENLGDFWSPGFLLLFIAATISLW